jgi:lambda family phage minor tail protein L
MKLDIESLISLFILDLSPIITPAVEYAFCSDQYASGSAVIFQGRTYQPLPIMIDNFNYDIRGNSYNPPSPTITMGNVLRTISTLCHAYSDLRGAKLWHKQTFVKYLDGMPGANSTLEFNPQIYYVQRKVSEDKIAVVFELATAFTAGMHQTLPARKIIKDRCVWLYRDENCGYTGGAVADVNDNPTSNLALDYCSRTLKGCSYRYPNEKPFGGFPKADTIRL